jgi:hypothetical protein
MIIIIKQFHLLTIVDNEGLVKGLQTMTGVGGGGIFAQLYESDLLHCGAQCVA